MRQSGSGPVYSSPETSLPPGKSTDGPSSSWCLSFSVTMVAASNTATRPMACRRIFSMSRPPWTAMLTPPGLEPDRPSTERFHRILDLRQVHDLETRQALEQAPERDLGLDARELRAEAEVNATAEALRAHEWAGDVEPVRIRVNVGIA